MNNASLNAIKKKLRRPIPFRGFERKLYAAVILSVVLGITWSISARDWQYFERSGSLLIIAGITMTWFDFVQLLGEVELLYQDEIQRLSMQLDAIRPTGLIAAASQDAKREELTIVASKFELTALFKKRLRTTEAIVLSFGTFIWGYGSTIANLFWSFK